MNFSSGIRFRLLLSVLLSFMVIAVRPATAQVVFTKLGNGNNSPLVRVKTTSIGDDTYSVVLFEKRVTVLDQNAQIMASVDLFNGRALATSGNMIYVLGARTATQTGLEVIKYAFDPAARKITQKGNPGTLASAVYTADLRAYSCDMCVAGGRVWLCGGGNIYLNSQGQTFYGGEQWRLSAYSEGTQDTDIKLQSFAKIPANTNYYDGFGTFTFGTGGGLIDSQTGGTAAFLPITKGLRMHADPVEPNVFWMAFHDGYDKSIRVVRVGFNDEGVLTVPSRPSQPKKGGLSIYGATEGSGAAAIVTGFVVDTSYVYVSVYSAQALAKVYRIEKSEFLGVGPNPAVQPGVPMDVARVSGIEPASTGEVVAPADLAVVDRRVTLVGVYGRLKLQFYGTNNEPVERPFQGISALFLGRLKEDFSAWEMVETQPTVFGPNGTTQPTFEAGKTGLVQATADGSSLLLAAQMVSGTGTFEDVEFGEAKGHFAILLSTETNRMTAQRFMLTVRAEGRAPDGNRSGSLEFKDAGLAPGFGPLSREAGTTVTVTSPEFIYQKKDRTYLDLKGKSAADIQELIQGEDVIARYRVTGYTVTRSGEAAIDSGTGNSVTLVMTKNSTVTFNYVREFALTVKSDVEGLPGVDQTGGQTLGLPKPASGRHWMPEEAEVIPELDMVTNSLVEGGTRYLAREYIITMPGDTAGTEKTETVAFTGTLTRQALKKFNMGGPVKITYKWKAQHSVTVQSTVLSAAQLPGIKAEVKVTDVNTGVISSETKYESGSGVFWFDRDTEMVVAAGDFGEHAVTGVFSATGSLGAISGWRRAELRETYTNGGKIFLGYKLRLGGAGLVVWDYGQPKYLQIVSIGSPVLIAAGSSDFGPGDVLTAPIAASINRNLEPKVAAFANAPVGTTKENAILWSPTEQLAYPLRPGLYVLEWTDSNAKKVLTEVIAGFPGDTVRHPALAANVVRKFDGLRRHLRAAVHEDMPAIQLDPNTGDAVAFSRLAYSAMPEDVPGDQQTAPVVAPQVDASKQLVFPYAGKSASDAVGRHVLVFTRSMGSDPATGDVKNEPVVVRVLETRAWNADKKWEPAATVNRVLQLDGASGYVRTPLRNIGGDALTIQFWFKGTNMQSAVRQQKGSEFILGGWGTRKWAVSNQYDPLTTAVNLPAIVEENKWHLVTLIWNKSNVVSGMTAYVDNIRQSSASPSFTPIPNIDAGVVFGAFLNGTTPSEFTNGMLDDISIWNRVLTEDEIRSTSSQRRQLSGTEPGLLGYWTFDNGTADDLSPGRNHGVLLGGAVIAGDPTLPVLATADDGTGPRMVAGRDVAGNPVPVEIPARVTDVFDTAKIGSGFVTGSKARYNARLYQRNAAAGTAGPIFPVNTTDSPALQDSFTVVWYEERDGVLWPWRPRVYKPAWPVSPAHRIVVASQLGSDGLTKDRKGNQPKFDPGLVSDLAVYSQNDKEQPGFNPNEEHALVSGSMLYGSQQPAHSAVYALRSDLNEAETSRPFVLAQWTNLATGQPEMRAYEVMMKDEAVKPFAFADGQLELRSPSIRLDERRVSIVPPVTLFPGEPLRVVFLEGAIEGMGSGQTIYPIEIPGSTTLNFSLTPGGPVHTTTQASVAGVVMKLFRVNPYVFEYMATAGQPVPVPNPLTRVIGPVPPQETTGGETLGYTNLSAPPPRVYFKDYTGMPWVISGGGARFHSNFFYRLQEGFWPTKDRDGNTVALNGPVEWLPGDRVNYTAQWPANPSVLKVGETLTFAGGEYREDRPDSPGLPGVVGWAAGRVVYDSRTPAMDREPAIANADDKKKANARTFTDYTARLISPLETRRVALSAVLGSTLNIEKFKAAIAPSTGVVRVDGAVWRFRNLPASLRSRVYFDPIRNEVGIQGYVNGKTLGDQTLTATPEPAYVLEPNILRKEDRDMLLEFKADVAEQKTIGELFSSDWVKVVDGLYAASRNPAKVNMEGETITEDKTPYYVGLDWAPQKDGAGNVVRFTGDRKVPVLLPPKTVLPKDPTPTQAQIAAAEAADAAAKAAAEAKAAEMTAELPVGYVAVPGQPVPTKLRAAPAAVRGPGLALVCSPQMLEKSLPDVDYYVTVAENDDAALGLPVTMHIVKVAKKNRYRGAIRLVEGDNALSEKVTLRHTADFGANTEGVRFQWFFRPEDGRSAAVPYAGGSGLIGAWQLFPDLTGRGPEASGYQIDINGQGKYILPDLWFVARYGHTSDVPSTSAPSWAGSLWAIDGKPDVGVSRGELWAGAANSPQPSGDYLAQLVPGWLKRVLDRINPYEARFTDFRANNAPATYASMIQQAGPAYNGPVALNPSKDVIENTGLIQLYQTILDRAKLFGLDPTITDPALRSAIMNALQLAATRIQDLYMVIGNEAYADSQDPLIGFGSNSAAYGTSAASIWTFMNQTSDALEEELALLRGVAFSYGRPVYNRLFWNFTKDLGEVAYAQTYNLSDENRDGFINESDAMLRYPMGHGDAWGHYTTAVKLHYDLLRSSVFAWQPRSEFYSLLSTVIPVDFYDERKFAAAAAARAKTGADVVSLTYRQRYSADPDGQWQGYGDTDPDRAWGVEQWARRAGQAALLDWTVGNSLLPATSENRGDGIAVSTVVGNGLSGESYRVTIPLTSGLPRVDGNGAPRYLLTLTSGKGVQEAIFTASGNVMSTSLRMRDFGVTTDNGVVKVTAFTVDLPVGSAEPGLTTANFRLAQFERPEGLQQVDRTTVDALDSIAREYARIENTVLDANGGLNPLGLAKDAVPFDIDPGLYAGRNGTQPVSHFEQIYDRARRAVANARVIFDGSTEALNATRQNQDTLEDFSRDVVAGDRDYRNRLIDIFGTPHAGNIGTGKVYPAGYTGPDLYFYQYVDVNDVSETTVPAVKDGLDKFQTVISGFKQTMLLTDSKAQDKLAFDSSDQDNYFVNSFNKLFLDDYPASKAGDLTKVPVIDNSQLVLELPIRAKGYAFDAPKDWGIRDRTGELQTLISSLVQAETELALAVADYSKYVDDIDGTVQTIAARHGTALQSLDTLEKERIAIGGIAAAKATANAMALFFRNASRRVNDAEVMTAAVVPNTTIAGVAAGGDFLKITSAPVFAAGAAQKAFYDSVADGFEASTGVADVFLELANYNVAISELEAGAKYEIQQMLIALKSQLKDEPLKRMAVLQTLEAMRQASDAYRSKLYAGLDLMSERAEFNRNAAGVVQEHRYQDMAFRLFRNEGLDKFRAAFELAAKYTWLAAKAYEYETNLPENHPGSAQSILESIVTARLVGDVTPAGEPVASDGLADALAMLRDNYAVLKGQLGLNNAQTEDSRISLRHELFRLRAGSDADFRAELNRYRAADLNEVPEFRRFCRPFAAVTTAQPGLVIPMPTTITAGQNLFGKDLGPADHSFDSSMFATKVSGVGVWFEGYDLAKFAGAPRVYLVPAGNDAMLEPTSTTFEPRWWTVVDQRIPVPQMMGSDPLGNPNWSPVADTLDGLPGEIRKFSSFRAYSGVAGNSVDPAEMSFDSRLVGRSVWNDKWLLIIPGQTLGADSDASLTQFLGSGGIKDIHLVFKTFGFSGN